MLILKSTVAIRHFISTPKHNVDTVENAAVQYPIMHDAPDQATSLALSPKRREPEAWVALVNDFLPHSLRSVHYADEECKEATETSQLPLLLAKARSTTPLKMDILSYMGIHQGRWDAVRWIVKNIARECPVRTTSEEEDKLEKSRTVPWSITEPTPYGNLTLDEITSVPVHFGTTVRDSVKEFIGKRVVRLGFESYPTRVEWLGQVWAMLASMILRAADYCSDDTDSRSIMSFVLEMLAHLHHIDAVPRTVYTHSETSDDSTGYKPPTLSLMAYRIMTTLSDSAWRAQDEEIRREAQTVGAKNWYKGHEVPEATMQPRVDRLGEEIWLELILWCCIEGGYIPEASWIVTEMSKRKGNLAWRVIAWSEIRRPEEPRMNWSAKAELQIAREHMSRIGPHFGILGPSEAPPLVDMGSRTVSREVILALIDGLATSLRPVVEVQQQIVACRNLLNKKRSLDLETGTLNKAVLGIFQSGLVDSDRSPESADRVLDLAPIHQGISEYDGDSLQSQLLNQLHEEGNSAACLGLLHRTLYSHVVKGNIQASLRTFHKIQTIIDVNRNRQIDSFALELKRRSRNDSTDQLVAEDINSILPSPQPQVPVHILSAFLNLLTSAHLHDLGNWLLYSNEVDGPFIPQSLYSEPNVQSALLRFATVTQNGQLFARISEKLRAPLAPDILRTLLHCQITLGKWDQAEEVLQHFKAEGIGWKEEDLMVIARSILRLEHERGTPQMQSLAKAQNLLQGLLNGNFSPRRDPSQALDYSNHRRLSQIYRMFRTLPGTLYNLKEPPFSDSTRANAPIDINTEAFNILLEGLAETKGSLRALKLWRMWCRPDPVNSSSESEADFDALGASVQEHQDDVERVVMPTLQTLRVLMRPLVKQDKVAAGSREARLVEWAVGICRGFGLTEKEIEYELGGLWSSK